MKGEKRGEINRRNGMGSVGMVEERRVILTSARGRRMKIPQQGKTVVNSFAISFAMQSQVKQMERRNLSISSNLKFIR